MTNLFKSFLKKTWHIILPSSISIAAISLGSVIQGLKDMQNSKSNFLGFHPAKVKLNWILYAVLFTTFFYLIVEIINNWRKKRGYESLVPPLVKEEPAISKEKLKAQHPPISDDYLSKRYDEGLLVGRNNNMFVSLPITTSPSNLVIIGAPGSGKSSIISTSLLINNNLANKNKQFGGLVVVDCKPEYGLKCDDMEDENCYVFNPSSYKTCIVDPFYGLNSSSSDDAIRERSEILVKSLVPDLSGDNSHFSKNAQKILIAVLMYGFIKGYTLPETISHLLEIGTKETITEIIMDRDMDTHIKIKSLIISFDGNNSNEFSSIVTTLETSLYIFQNDTVVNSFDTNNIFEKKVITPEKIRNGARLYIAIPDAKLNNYSTVMSMVMEVIIKGLMDADEEDLDGERPVGVIVDEAGTIYIPSLNDGSLLARGRSKRIQTILIIQSVSQLNDLYSLEKSRAIIDCCNVSIILSCYDNETARMICSWVEDYKQTKITYQSNGIHKNGSESTSYEYRSVLEPYDLRLLEKNNEALVFTKDSWFLVKKLPYYEVDFLNKKSKELVQKNKNYLNKNC